MAYSGEAVADTGTGFVELNPIYCSPELMEACKLIKSGYDRPLDHAAELALADVSGRASKKRKNHKRIIEALIGENWLYDMLVNWLRDEHGWDVRCPVTSQHVYDNGELRKLKWGNRVGVASDEGYAEIDCLPTYGNRWIIGEAKSGVNSYDTGVVNRRISRLGKVVQQSPCFVLGVPRDHQIIRDGSYRYIEQMGGRVLVFSATSADIHQKAIELYRGWNIPVDGRQRTNPHRKHANERTGRNNH